MRKAEFIDWVAWKIGAPRYAVTSVLRGVVLGLQEALKSRERVTLWGLGTFSTKGRTSRMIVDFDGRYTDISPGQKVCFKPSPSLRKAVKR